MKQRITSSQLQQLTPSQQEKLREIWEPEKGDYILLPNGETLVYGDGTLGDEFTDDEFYYFYGDEVKTCEPFNLNECLPVLNVGQCIEFLREYDLDIVDNNSKIGEWSVSLNKPINDDYIQVRNEELINALFEAIKSIL